MSCSGCGKTKAITRATPDMMEKMEMATKDTGFKVVAKSDDAEKVRVRYYGGGFSNKKVKGCSACGKSKNSYYRLTSELIVFASDDEPNGMYKVQARIGNDYWVTKTQAEYMTAELTYTNQSGEVCHKFKYVTD